jgi:hypothetical protein
MPKFSLQGGVRMFKFLPLQGGGQEGDGVIGSPNLPHPHPYPPLEGEGVYPTEDQPFKGRECYQVQA